MEQLDGDIEKVTRDQEGGVDLWAKESSEMPSLHLYLKRVPSASTSTPSYTRSRNSICTGDRSVPSRLAAGVL